MKNNPGSELPGPAVSQPVIQVAETGFSGRHSIRIRRPRIGYDHVSRRIPLAVYVNAGIEAVPVVVGDLSKLYRTIRGNLCRGGACHLLARLYFLYGQIPGAH